MFEKMSTTPTEQFCCLLMYPVVTQNLWGIFLRYSLLVMELFSMSPWRWQNALVLNG